MIGLLPEVAVAKSTRKRKKPAPDELESDATKPGSEATKGVPSRLERAIGSDDETLQLDLICNLLETLWLPEGTSDETKQRRIDAAVSVLEGIQPRDTLERMLGVQMVATHDAAMECLRRAALENQTFPGRDMSLKHATKLLAIYARQMETLDKHRRKGQQTVTVEYVNVEAGGQAIVGNVGVDKTAQTDAGVDNSPAPAISHNPGEVVDMELEEKPQKVKRKRRKVRR